MFSVTRMLVDIPAQQQTWPNVSAEHVQHGRTMRTVALMSSSRPRHLLQVCGAQHSARYLLLGVSCERPLHGCRVCRLLCRLRIQWLLQPPTDEMWHNTDLYHADRAFVAHFQEPLPPGPLRLHSVSRA